jgi:hypothetical protein
MSEKKLRSLPEVIKSIEGKSGKIKDLATAISDRIILFEKWLGTLPGRVDAAFWMDDPEEDPRSGALVGLRVHRAGKQWLISYGFDSPGRNPDEPVNWTPLAEAPLKFKLLALEYFPNLLASMEKQQDYLCQKMVQSAKDFDVFAATIGIASVKEGQ